jgi:hypothetical protein
MSADAGESPRTVLDPIDRISESLFGLIMVLTFTRSLNAAQSGHAEVRDMLIGAVGCNLAWGIVDAVMYLMTCWTERARHLMTLHAVRAARDAAAAHRVIAGTMHPAIAAGFSAEALEAVRVRLLAEPEPPQRPSLKRRDWLGAGSVFLWVFLITFPIMVQADTAVPALSLPFDIRWAREVDDASRARLEADLGLMEGQPVTRDERGRTWTYRMRYPTQDRIRTVLRHPLVEDTARIDAARLEIVD